MTRPGVRGAAGSGGGAGVSAAARPTAQSAGGPRDLGPRRVCLALLAPGSPGMSAESAAGASSREGDPGGAHGPRGAAGELALPAGCRAAWPGVLKCTLLSVLSVDTLFS